MLKECMSHCRYRRIIPFRLLCLILALTSYLFFYFVHYRLLLPPASTTETIQRIECNCDRSRPASTANSNDTHLCSPFATGRGPHQRVISISLFGPKENKLFQVKQSLIYLNQLIEDVNQIYPDGFILRVHHDDTINRTEVICPIECNHPNVDFCDMHRKLFMPPKIWRFIPAGDPLVDVMMSRDLDSPLTARERAAVNEWLSSNESFHAMRDHPMHGAPMLGGMWGFRPPLDPVISRSIHEKIHNVPLVARYGGTGDQTFLANEVWPHVRTSAVVHDSFLCMNGYGKKSRAFPTQRPSANQSSCFIGCVRPCCVQGKMPFGHCPTQCRPSEHPEWLFC